MPGRKYRVSSLSFLAGFLLLSACGNGADSSDLLDEGTFTPGIEGPATDAAGNVYAVNYAEEGTIGRVTPSGEASLFLKLPEGSVGNGIAFGPGGDMFIADYVGHRVYRVPAGTTTPQVWAEEPRMNQPNDLCIHPDGSIYLSDPDWSRDSGNIWRVRPDRTVELLESGMGTTNGIALSPDHRHLYVNESVQRTIWRYTLDPDGQPGQKEKFFEFADFGLDGMRCDQAGNLYIARYDKGTIAVLSPEGIMLKEYQLSGKKPSNLTFAGPDGKTGYVTLADRGCFELFEALHPGAGFSD
ncbi:SMP-30/gluconolactonase/LRE family protein [Robiginitalea sp. SC105]|uniref:SMP-30/gluconolactonase/LRE family protein n=1 Tax=Robiginitalea sp. SC105 TaxID=2762332 RepID=UPI00163A413E|nr:SMP-30/gluconolactonase/LRE family protein [Robiginitalea sp. SC105]MBC2838180.1 SMP-30/gluconolactonase/LRE family protein [Robiginitalea sp. SC105]